MNEADADTIAVKDISPWIWLGLPLLSMTFCCGVAIFGGPGSYHKIISASERAYLEYSMPVLLLPAVFMAGCMFFRRRTFPQTAPRIVVAILALGALYFAGEEISWGQTYFQWGTPEWVGAVNDQNETNIHNMSGLFDQFPRGLLTAGAVAAFVLPFFRIPQRKNWTPQTHARYWLWPTFAAVPAGLLVCLVGLPQKFYGHYGARDAAVPQWIDAMFLRGHHSELKEHFLAMFIFIYVLSLTWRFRQFRAATAAHSGEKRQ